MTPWMPPNGGGEHLAKGEGLTGMMSHKDGACSTDTLTEERVVRSLHGLPGITRPELPT